MMSKLAFFKKEIREILKTYKIIVLPVIFLFFGLLSPITAKYMPVIIEKLGSSTSGVTIQVSPKISYTAAYEQLFSNIGQMGLIVIILVFMGIVAGEKVKGSAALVLTKTVSRTQFILGKFFASVLLFTFSYLLSVTACIYYTYVLFGKFYNGNLVTGLFIAWVYMVFIIAMTVFASTISKNYTIAAVLSFLGFILFSAITALPHIKNISPSTLEGLGLQLIKGGGTVSDIYLPLSATLVMIVLLIGGGIFIFRKQEI